MTKFKRLSPKQKECVSNEVKLMLAAHRSHLWDRYITEKNEIDPNSYTVVANDGFYGEAFGVMRGLIALGYGYFGSDTNDATQEGRSAIPEHNLKWWFSEILKQYLLEEGYYEKTCSPRRAHMMLERYKDEVRA